MTDEDEDDDDGSSGEFHYPQSSTPETPRPASRSSGSTAATSRVPVDLTPHLTQAPDFRVPTHEAPQKVLSPRRTPPTPQQFHTQWERDEAVQQCRDCQRRFNLLNRRVRFCISIVLRFLILLLHTACKSLKYSQRSFC
jgi:hypothetical protein